MRVLQRVICLRPPPLLQLLQSEGLLLLDLKVMCPLGPSCLQVLELLCPGCTWQRLLRPLLCTMGAWWCPRLQELRDPGHLGVAICLWRPGSAQLQLGRVVGQGLRWPPGVCRAWLQPALLQGKVMGPAHRL